MRYITLAIAFLIGTNAQAQIIRAEPFYVAPEEAVSGNLLLDNYPGAAVAYSLRKLDKDYTGSAIRVRRSSDNTEQDIGFLASGFLDTAAMKTFVGANNGFVVTWYNQADSAGVFGVRNATIATAANQPQIIQAGVINRDNTLPSLKFDGGDDYLQQTSNILSTSNPACSFFFVANKFNYGTTTNNASASIGFGNVGTAYFYIPIRPNGTSAEIQFRAAGDSNSRTYNTGDNFTNNALHYFNTIDNGSNVIVYQNNTEILASSSTTIGTFNPAAGVGFRIGHVSGSGISYWIGNMSEIVLYASDQASNRTAIRDNINSFYSIY